jgi:predicted AlkP superfamily phosphohydrolase/phosphomutase/Flp pilus assembly protein TadD
VSSRKNTHVATRTRRGVALLAAVFLVALPLTLAVLLGPGCGKAPQAPKVLIVGVDGADWRLMRPLLDAGELPHMQALIDTGIAGPLMSLYPIISPVIWTTIATGKGPDHHGSLDFTMPDPVTGQPIIASSSLRRSKAFWNILSEQGLRVCVVGWWASWPAEPVDGVIVSDRISYHAFIETPEAESGLVYPPEKLDEILALREGIDDVPYSVAKEFMDITEEEYEAAPALDFGDPISHFRHIYRTMASYAAMAKRLIVKEHPDVMAVYFEGVDTAGHMYMRYAPPVYPYTTAEQRQKFGRTVEAFYRYQDRLLGELLELTDENTTVMVLSDHGFLSGRERPIEEASAVNYATAARWHRIQGVIIMKGPQILSLEGQSSAETPLRRATVFDITPTLLALLGIPCGTDMDGRVLAEALVEGFETPAVIDSHEDEAWREDRAAAQTSLRGVDEEMKERLRSLGYIGASEYEETLSLRAQWGLAEYYMFRNEFDKAQKELEEVAERAPDLPETYYLLGVIHMQRKEYDQAGEMYEKSLELAPDKLEARVDLATIYRQQGQRERAIALLEKGAETYPYDVRVRVNLGMLHKELGQLESALDYFAETLRLDPDTHPAHAQMALVYEQLDRYEDAVAHWVEALRIFPRDRTAREHLTALQEKGYGTTTGQR